MTLDPRFRAGFTADITAAPIAIESNGSDDPVRRGEHIYKGTNSLVGMESFIGQEMAKRQVTLAIASAKSRGSRLDHTLLASGIAGIGKTTMARHIAYEMGVGIVEASGKIGWEDVVRLAGPMQTGDILFIDECHTIGKGKGSAWLLPLMTEGQILTPSGPIDMPDITIIGATTDCGQLSEAMLSRFKLKPRLTYYNISEAAEIANQFGVRNGIWLDELESEIIAEAANRNPRQIENLVTVARDLKEVEGEINMDTLFELCGVTPDGLDENMQGYLMALYGSTNYQAAVATLQAILGEPGPIAFMEKDLMARGFVEILPRGRKLTTIGVKRTQKLMGIK